MFKAGRFILLMAAAFVVCTLAGLGRRPVALAQDAKPDAPVDRTQVCLSPSPSGRPILGYGEQTQFATASKGIVIETRRNAQVVSPCDGWVVFAGEHRSYGRLVIINVGEGYHFLLAGLEEASVEPGQFVLVGEPVGTMPQGTTNDPVLYLELRKDGQTVDPARKLQKN